MELNVRFEPLRPETDSSGFSCGDCDLDEFYQSDAEWHRRKHVAYTTICVDNDTNEVLGFVTLACDAIRLAQEEQEDLPTYPIPAVKLCRLGVATQYQNRRVGSALVEYAIGAVVALQEEGLVAARFLTVDAYAARESWYQRFGFTRNQARRHGEHISMRRLVVPSP